MEWKKRLNDVRPKGPYYKQSEGDFMLFLTKVDTLDYDILEQEEVTKKKLIEMELGGVGSQGPRSTKS